MPLWAPPSNSYSDAFRQPPVLPTVKVETKGASAYEQEQSGQRSETSQPIPISRGEIETTSRGDYRVQTRTIVTATETYEETVTVTDLGGGAANLVPVTPIDYTDYTVYQAPSSAPDTTAPMQAQDPAFDPYAQWNFNWIAFETAPSYDPTESNAYSQPETAPPPVYYAPLPVEQAPVDQPQYVQEPDTGGAIAFFNHLASFVGNLLSDLGITFEEDPPV